MVFSPGEKIIYERQMKGFFKGIFWEDYCEMLESQILENECSMRINILGFIINTSKLKSTSLEKIIKFFSHTFGGI